MLHAAVILSGCGVYDGSEIHEAVAVLYHLSRRGVRVQCFAPDKPQADIVNHALGRPVSGESRNVLHESARIARGQIQPLTQLKASAFDAAFFPGGFGAPRTSATSRPRGPSVGSIQRSLASFASSTPPASPSVSAASPPCSPPACSAKGPAAPA
jgi:enhancing lycopene biosynthesis protein 2